MTQRMQQTQKYLHITDANYIESANWLDALSNSSAYSTSAIIFAAQHNSALFKNFALTSVRRKRDLSTQRNPGRWQLFQLNISQTSIPKRNRIAVQKEICFVHNSIFLRFVFSTPGTKSTLFTNKQAFAAYKDNLQYCTVYYLQRKFLAYAQSSPFLWRKTAPY